MKYVIWARNYFTYDLSEELVEFQGRNKKSEILSTWTLAKLHIVHYQQPVSEINTISQNQWIYDLQLKFGRIY